MNKRRISLIQLFRSYAFLIFFCFFFIQFQKILSIHQPPDHPLIYTQTFFYLLIFKYCFICLISRSVVCLQSYTLLILILSDNAIYMQKKDTNRTDRITRINWMHLGYTGYGIAHYYLSSVNLGSVKMCTILIVHYINRLFSVYMTTANLFKKRHYNKYCQFLFISCTLKSVFDSFVLKSIQPPPVDTISNQYIRHRFGMNRYYNNLQ